MQHLKMNGELYKELVINGAANLALHYKEVDALNVFPVPDGDTGTNMRMTIEAGANELKKFEEKSIYEVAKKLSRGMLMGARGNSGVILSQFFRGIYKGLAGFEEVQAKDLAKAFLSGVDQAYHAVMKPVEGTILTVARESAKKAYKTVKKGTTIEAFFKILIDEAHSSLGRTPSLLPALQEAGVVDSGGAGLVYVFEGMLKALHGETVKPVDHVQAQSVVASGSFNADSELEYGYCTEFILQLQNKKVDVEKFDVKVIVEFLESLGDSIVALKDEDIVKVHVHTKTPGVVLNHCQQYGEYVTLKIENMSVQHSESQVDEGPKAVEDCDCPQCVEIREKQARKKFAIVAVASGEGLIEVFKEIGVDYVVEGGQSMNPSAEDFVKGFDSLNAENIIVFPNNSNIVLTAEQAGKYYENARVFVAPSKSLAQGYSALTMLDLSSGNIETIINDIKDVISNVTTGLVTYSIRNAEIEGVHINEGDYIGICNGKIVVSKEAKIDAVKGILESENALEKEIITIIYGKDVTEEELSEVQNLISENYPNLEVDTINGKQDIYSYVLSIE